MNDGVVARAQRIGLGVLLALGSLDTWRYINYQANPDGVSYVDLAIAFMASGPQALVNGYWSPGLPALIGVAYRVVPPTPDTMYPTAHAVGYVMFVLATVFFHRMVTAVRREMKVVAGAPVAAQVAIVVIGWCTYALFILKGIGVQLITPDIGVAAIVFWLVAESLALDAAPWAARRWAFAGAVLAVGYWWKAILFPVGIAWFLAAAFVALRRGDPRRGPLTAGLAYGALSLLLIVPVSRHTGRATFGETGRLNYLWYVNAAPYVWERCLPPSIGDAAAAPFGAITRAEVIFEHPLTCRLSSPLSNATMPLWDDPSRFYRDAHPRVDATRQFRAIRNNVAYLAREIADLGPVLFMMTALVGLAASGAAVLRWRARRRAGMGPAELMIGTLVAAPIAFYLLVYVEFRHLAPFFAVAALLGTCAALGAWPRRGSAVIALVVVAALTDVVWRMSTQTLIGFTLLRATIAGRGPERIPETQRVARALLASGLAPGTHVASIYNEWNAEWAQLARLRIRAHVPEMTTPLPGVLRALRDPCVRAAWDSVLHEHGIEAVVARVPRGLPAPPAFERILDSEFHLHRVAAGARPPVPECAPLPRARLPRARSSPEAVAR